MKKPKKMPIMLIAIAIVGGLVFYSICNSDKLQPVKEEKNRTLAMYIENETGEYVISSDQEFPTDGYVLDRAECKKGGVITQNSTTKKISVKITDSDSCNLYFAIQCPTSSLYATTTLANGLKVYDSTATTYNECNSGEMYTFMHNDLTTTTEYNGTTYMHSATQVADWTEEERTDYRYIGSTPNNWVRFNDEDWRIIGVFTVETAAGKKEQLIKIIRNESIGDMSWDDYTDGSRSNEWTTASLKTMLNGQYYNTADSFDYTNKYNSSTTTTVTIPKGLNSTAQNQVEEVKWYLGGSKTNQNLGGQDYYNFERGETVYTGRSTSTIAKVGLMYPSDYVYTYANGVDNTCYTNGYNCQTSTNGTPTNGWLHNSDWLYNSAYQWMLSPRADTADYAFRAISLGYVYSYYVNDDRDIRPTVYLKSGIKIISGIGTSSNPYILA